MKQIMFPAEWHPQSAVQLTWPHHGTDWTSDIDEVVPCFVEIAKEIMKREKLLIVCPDKGEVMRHLEKVDSTRIIFIELMTNDTWARDHGGITVFEDGAPKVYDFVFNGWGMKYAANYDNLITRRLKLFGAFEQDVKMVSLPFVLEGGSIESNGRGTLLTTRECLCSENRNDNMNDEEIEKKLRTFFGIKHFLWLDNGYLAGDDTNSHIDMLARFCNEQTIAYVKCEDETDEHFYELNKMEKELKDFRTKDGKPYRLIPLPMADEVVWEGKRLPATYANFLIINGAVLVPFYQSQKDEIAQNILQNLFPDREIVGINCLPLLKQRGSLHCVTMQYPEGTI